MSVQAAVVGEICHDLRTIEGRIVESIFSILKPEPSTRARNVARVK
jgi:hypothetical protein